MPNLKEVSDIIKTAKQEELEGRKCFVVPWDSFVRLVDILQDSYSMEGSTRLAAAGYNNFEIRLTVEDKGVYYVASRSGPILDQLWKGEK